MSKPTVAIPQDTALELRNLVGRAIQAADRAEQQGQPLPHVQYQRMCWLYADLDKAIAAGTGNLTRFPQSNGANRS